MSRLPLTLAALAGAAVLVVLVPIAGSPLALIGVLVGALIAAELTLRGSEALTTSRRHTTSAPHLPSRS